MNFPTFWEKNKIDVPNHQVDIIPSLSYHYLITPNIPRWLNLESSRPPAASAGRLAPPAPARVRSPSTARRGGRDLGPWRAWPGTAVVGSLGGVP